MADVDFEPTPPDGRVRGFGRELARRGYATMSISIKGCHGRPGPPGSWEQEAKYLEAYGRPQMGIIALKLLPPPRPSRRSRQASQTGPLPTNALLGAELREIRLITTLIPWRS